MFVHSQIFLIQKQIKKLEKSIITVIEVKNILEDTKKQLTERVSSKYLGIQASQTYNKLKKHKEITLTQEEEFEKDVENFFNVGINYLAKWSVPLAKHDVFSWMLLQEVPEWEHVEKTIAYLSEIGILFTDSIYEEVMYMKSFIKNKTCEEWKTKDVHDKWLYYFIKTEETERKANLLKMCQYLFAIPRTMHMLNVCSH